MPIHFCCDSCGKQLQVKDSMAGSRARCPKCGTVVTVPMPAAELQPLGPAGGAAAFGKSATGSQIPGAEPSGGIPLIVWYLIGGGAAFVLFAMGIAVILSTVFSSWSESETKPVAATGTDSSPSPTLPGSRASRPSNASSYRPRSSDAPRAPARAAATGSFGPGQRRPSDDKSKSFDATTPAQPERGAKPRPAATGSPSWKTGQLRIPFEKQDELTFGPIGCPVLIAGQDVWHLEQKRMIGNLQGEIFRRGLKSLSGDGQWFAAALKSHNQKDTSIRVWNTLTGKPCCEIPGDPEKFADLILFSRNRYLLIGGRLSNEIQVWDVEAGKRLSTITTPTQRLEVKQTTFSADGQYFTAVVKNRLCVVRTKTRTTAAVMESPQPMLDSQETLNELQREMRAREVFSQIKTVRFSPDGQELAAVTGYRQPRLVCWNSRGKLVFNAVIPQVQHAFFFDPTFDWLPDGSGWIISGHVYDRRTKRIVFAIRTPFGDDPLFFPLDRNRLVGAFPHDPDALQVIDIPWDRINASMRLLDEKAPAILSPNEPVSIDILLAGRRTGAGPTEMMFVDALSKRLMYDGIRVEAGQSTYFCLRFSEKAGDTLAIYERQSPFDFFGHDTGRTATEVAGLMVVELIADGETLWRDTIGASSSRHFDEAINNATIRKSMLENVTRGMNQLSIPYFIPKSPDHMALPIVLK